MRIFSVKFEDLDGISKSLFYKACDRFREGGGAWTRQKGRGKP